MTTKILLFILWFIVWTLLSWPPDAQQLVIGLFAALFVTMMTKDMFVKNASIFRKPMRYVWFLCYIFVFLWECLKANLDVAWRVIHPNIPIRPGTIKVRTSLKSDAGLTFLANSITLTPGTTTVDIDSENGIIYIHWLCVKEGYDNTSMRLPVVERFENILKRIFE